MGLKLINNNKSHWPFIFFLRFHPSNIKGFYTQDKVSYESHISYMKSFGKCYKIATLNSIPVGFIGDVNQDIRIAIHPDMKNKGIGFFMLKTFTSENKLYRAKILNDNTPSIKLFESCGFIKIASDQTFNYYEKNNTQPL